MNLLPEILVLAPRTLLRRGCVTTLAAEMRAYGTHGLLVHGRSMAAHGVPERICASAPPGVLVQPWVYDGGEPTLDGLEALRAVVRDLRPDWVAGLGGGSVLDVAKAAAGLAHAPLPAERYHDGQPLPDARVPFAAVPTTAGTGSEATAVSVLTNLRTGVKKSFRHPSHMARLILLDADLLDLAPPATIAASGMDALVQAVESYLSRGATEFTDSLALLAVRRILENLERAYAGAQGTVREELLAASYAAGVALAHARLGLVHGLAHPLGARFHIPHGIACAVCFPAVLRFNRAAAGAKYERLCALAGGDFVERAEQLLAALAIRSPLAGAEIRDLDAIVAETLASGSTAANPRPVSGADVERILRDLQG